MPDMARPSTFSMLRCLIAAVLASLALVSGAPAAPPAGMTEDPFTTFVVTRILPNGRETVLGTASVTDVTQEQVIRQTALAAARQNRTNNPSWRIVIYGPIDPPLTYWTDDDRIWDSATDL